MPVNQQVPNLFCLGKQALHVRTKQLGALLMGDVDKPNTPNDTNPLPECVSASQYTNISQGEVRGVFQHLNRQRLDTCILRITSN